jgi:hypothetical protein
MYAHADTSELGALEERDGYLRTTSETKYA